MTFPRFRQIIDESALYLPNAYAYEDTDVNEGRFGRRYVDVLRRAYELACGGDGSSPSAVRREARSQVVAHCALLKAHREYSYVSCWTLREEQSWRMWRSFAPNGQGVAIKSTVGMVYDNLKEGASTYFGDVRHRVQDGLIVYDRETAHRRLGWSTMDDLLLPLFSLDGGADNFGHEREYRFVVTDLEGASDAGQDYVAGGARPSLVRRGQPSARRGNSRKVKGVLVPVSLGDLIMEVRTDPRGGRGLGERVTRLLNRAGLEVGGAP